ncbi:MAG: hypothetical protein CMJ46_06680 [Planctomyces sp.]|nr:hypothetical protein [Planctomyces sp.]
MSNTQSDNTSWCLIHQLPETQASPYGRVCPHCKQKLYSGQAGSPRQRYWDSQPGAHLLSGEPCFVYNIVWANFQIRSLQFSEPATPTVPAPLLLEEFKMLANDDIANIADILKQRGLIDDIVPEPPAMDFDFDPPELDIDFGLDLPDFDNSEWEQD